ncbi:MAG: outer membrane beta-barrel protein [Anaeromyxobacteraceae bacterium]
MRKLLLAIAALVFATTVSAQEAAPAAPSSGGKPMIGVGVALGGSTFLPGVTVLPGGSNKILIPINVSPSLRVEPFLGYTQVRTKDSSSPLGDDVDWASTLTVGAGIYLLGDLGNNAEVYGGGRLAINRVAAGFEYKSSGTTVSGDDSFIGFGLAAVGGAEYYLSPRFALGVEAELGFDSIETAQDFKETKFGTAAFLTARAYFK